MAKTAICDFDICYSLFAEAARVEGVTPPPRAHFENEIAEMSRSPDWRDAIFSEVRSFRIDPDSPDFPGKKIRRGFLFNPEKLREYDVF
jgi:hypothetical protein